MATFTSTAATINGRLPAFYALPTASGSKLPVSTLPFTLPLPVSDVFANAVFPTSSAANGSYTNCFNLITLTGVVETSPTGTLPAIGDILIINNVSFYVLASTGTAANGTLTITSKTAFPLGSAIPVLGSNSFTDTTAPATTGTFTGGTVVSLLGNPVSGQTARDGAGQSLVALIFGAGGQTWDIGASYTLTGSTSWLFPAAVVAGGTTYAIFMFPADVAPEFAGSGGVTLQRTSEVPVVGDILSLTDSTNRFIWTVSPNDSQNQYWRVFA